MEQVEQCRNQLSALHRKFVFLYVGHRTCRGIAAYARNLQIEVPGSLRQTRWSPTPPREDWEIDIRLILDALAYSYDNLGAVYLQQMTEIQAEFRQVTALAEADICALLDEARQAGGVQATGSSPAGNPGETRQDVEDQAPGSPPAGVPEQARQDEVGQASGSQPAGEPEVGGSGHTE